MRQWILRLLCLPADLPGYLVLGLACLFVKTRDRILYTSPAAWVTLPWRPWRWRASTLGHVIILWRQEGMAQGMVLHELAHVRQFEAGCLAGWLLVPAAWFLGPWAGLLAPFSAYLGASAAAWLRHGDWYRDNFLEEAARLKAARDAG